MVYFRIFYHLCFLFSTNSFGVSVCTIMLTGSGPIPQLISYQSPEASETAFVKLELGKRMLRDELEQGKMRVIKTAGRKVDVEEVIGSGKPCGSCLMECWKRILMKSLSDRWLFMNAWLLFGVASVRYMPRGKIWGAKKTQKVGGLPSYHINVSKKFDWPITQLKILNPRETRKLGDF